MKDKFEIWEHGTEMNPSCVIVCGKDFICQTLGGEDEEKATLICRACNNHEKLVEQNKKLLDACKYCHDLLESGVGQTTHAIAFIDEALALAEKGKEK